MLADRLGLPVEPDFRAYLRHAAETAGTSVAALVREAAERHAAEILSNRKAA